MGNFLHKQGHRVLNEPFYAYLLTALLAVLPFTDWLSLSVIALLTLRQGYWSGLKALLIGASLAVLVCHWRAVLPEEAVIQFLTFAAGYVAALILRQTACWTKLLTYMLVLTVLLVILVQMLAPEYVSEQFRAALALMEGMGQGKLSGYLALLKQHSQQPLLAHFLLGVQALGVVFSALCSLALARQVQSALFYPGEFRKEFLAFRATPVGVVMMLCAAVGAYQQNSAMISVLPILLVYAMCAGMLVFSQVVLKKKDRIAMLILILPLITAPYVVMPVYVLFGSLDSLFDFRRRLPSKAGE